MWIIQQVQKVDHETGQELVYAIKQAVYDGTEHQMDQAIAQAKNHAIGPKIMLRKILQNHFSCRINRSL